MNRSGAPANCWLLCLIYVCYLLNHIACSALDGKILLLVLTGISPDISIILLFTFYQPVFYATYDQHFPSESEERTGYWVGFGEHCGDAMTHKILDHDTQKITYRSAVRCKKSSTPNHRLVPHGGEVSASSDPSEDKISSGSPLGDPEGYSPKQKAPTVFVRSRDEENPSGSKPMPTFDQTEKIQSGHNTVIKSHNVGTRLFSGFLVSFASGVVEWNCWMKQLSNTQKQGALTAIQTGCLGALHGSQSLTALNS